MAQNEYGEKLDSNGYAPSILSQSSTCLICGRYRTARHEVFFGSYAGCSRIKSKGSFTRRGVAAFFVQEDTMSIQEILTAGGRDADSPPYAGPDRPHQTESVVGHCQMDRARS